MAGTPSRVGRLVRENRVSWNVVSERHARALKRAEQKLRTQRTFLSPYHREAAGNVADKLVLQPFCSFGLELLSIVRDGASGIGVDFAESAIQFAEAFHRAEGTRCQFHCEEIFRWFSQNERKLKNEVDLVLLTEGSICWVADLGRFVHHCYNVLRPSGCITIVDLHPFMKVFDERCNLKYSYFVSGKTRRWKDGVEEYYLKEGNRVVPVELETAVDEDARRYQAHEFVWTVEDIVQELIQNGFRISMLKEWPFLVGEQWFEDMECRDGRYFYRQQDEANIPLTLVVKAEKGR